MVFQGTFCRKETKFCLLIWVSAVLYAIYQFTVDSRKYFERYHDQYEDFTPGWHFLNLPKKDKADFEWESIGFIFSTIYPVMCCYMILSEFIRHLPIQTMFQKYFQILFPLTYLTYSMGYRVTLATLLQPVLFRMCQNKLLIWISNLVCLALIAIYKKLCSMEDFLKDLEINHYQAYLNILLLCWMNLKCTSFFLDNVPGVSLLDYIRYCYYLPTLYTGPFIGYKDYQKIYDSNSVDSLDRRLPKLSKNILRCIFWKIFADFWLHFVYVNAASFQLELVKQLDICSLCGYGYLMGQFFHIKYVVLYGLSTSLASFDNIEVPSLPRCIGRVHLYSDMWKHFDPGLHVFLKKCIFIPSLKLGVRKPGASLLCFLFVFLWHGVEEYILIWAALNFMGIILEDGVNTFYQAKLKSDKFIRKIGASNIRRIKCLLSAPLLAMSALSNFYFFAGKEVGDIYVEKFLNEPYSNKFLVFFILYCCCEVSTELRNVNAHKM